MDDGVFVWHMDVPYENSWLARGPGAKRRACRLGCAFFGYFLCTSKESDASRRARHLCEKRKAIPQSHETSAIADLAQGRRQEGYGLRCPSPQPLSPTRTSSGRRWERGFKGGVQRNSNRSASSIAGNFSRCAANAAAEIVVVTTPSPAGNSTTGCPRKSITALSPL